MAKIKTRQSRRYRVLSSYEDGKENLFICDISGDLTSWDERELFLIYENTDEQVIFKPTELSDTILNEQSREPANRIFSLLAQMVDAGCRFAQLATIQRLMANERERIDNGNFFALVLPQLVRKLPEIDSIGVLEEINAQKPA